MAREYHTEYTKNGGYTHEAMEMVLLKHEVPQNKWGQVSAAIRDYKSKTVISVTSKRVRFSPKRVFSEMSIPNGDRD